MTPRGLQVFLLVALVYIGLRLAAFLPSSVQTFPDTGTYLHTARESLLSQEFWAGWRPWTVPLFYKLLPDSDTARAVGQLVVSLASWLALAAAVAWNVRGRGMQLAAYSLVLLFSLSVWITQWDPLILSESLASSLAAAALAAWLALVRAPGPWTVGAVLVAMLLWASARDSLSLLALLAVPPALVWAMVTSRRREAVALASGLLLIGAANWLALRTDTAAPRARASVLNVIGDRVLTNPDQLRYFRDRGMPLPAEVAALAGTPLATGQEGPLRPDRPLAQNPRLAEFLTWARRDGRETLTAYLITHPYRAVEPVVDDAELLFEPEPDPSPENAPLDSYRSEGTDPLLPGPLAAAVYPASVAAVLAWFGLVALAVAWMARKKMARAIWLVPGAAVLLQLPHAALVWNADPVGITRHALTVGLVTRLGLLLLTIFLIDAALQRRDQRVSD